MRRPLIFVPGVLGSVLEGDGLHLWGRLRACYAGVPIDHDGAVVARDVLRAMDVVPGIYAFDVFASFERALLTDGFVAGDTWMPFAYDWRAPIVESAALLRDEIIRVSDRAGGPVDVFGFSTGGLVARAAVSVDLPDATVRVGDLAGRVANVIFAATMQTGALDGLLCLHRGEWLAPFGRWIEPDEMAGVRSAFDSMPWGRSVFRDVHGAVIDRDPYDVTTWRDFSMGIFAGVGPRGWRFVGSHRWTRRVAPDEPAVARLARSLRATREFHESLASPAAIAALGALSLHAIAGDGRETATALIVEHGRAYDPMRLPGRLAHARRFGIASGDGLVDDASMRALPVPFALTRIPGALHRTLITQPALHGAVLAVVGR